MPLITRARADPFRSLVRQAVIDSQPVGSDLNLGLLEGDLSCADLAIEIIFDLIFLVEAGRRAGRLRPEVSNSIRATQLQADQMIDLILAGQVFPDAIFG